VNRYINYSTYAWIAMSFTTRTGNFAVKRLNGKSHDGVNAKTNHKNNSCLVEKQFKKLVPH